MSQEVDFRIVEMRFDNKQFEAGAKTTMGTLGKLKEALKLPESEKALEGLDKATKNIKLDGIASGVEALEKRFSTMGIVGMRVIENITDGLMGKLNKAVGFVTDSIVSGGIKRAMNIENAHFQLQALLKDEMKVQAVMADAMESVDGTAYAYDEAAKAASQFAASGIEAGEDMLNALKGITGVAAMTNSSFEDVSRIFTTVAGNGRLMGDQLLQLSSRGLNAASTLADYFKEVRGQSGMTEATIREMVSKGKISFKDFSDAMTWAFGDSAKRANETFTGAMSNMKSALARIGAGFISPLVEQNGELVQLFNALRIKINDVKSALVFDEQRSAIAGMTKESNVLVETIANFTQSGKISFEDLTTAILGASKSEDELAEINQRLSDAYNEVKETGYATVDVMKEFKSSGINSYKVVQDYINGILDGSIRSTSVIRDSIMALTDSKVNILDVVHLAQDGQISYDLFTNAIANASGGVEKGTKLAEDSVKQMMMTVKEYGTVTSEMLYDFRRNGIDAGWALKKYIDGVSDGSIRASYATSTAIKAIKENAELADKSIADLADSGVISYDILQSAMEEYYGEEKTLSKQFTDFFLDHMHMIVEAINTADMTKPMEVFYHGVESVKNVLKGLYSVLLPVGKAFSEVFFSYDIVDTILSFSDAMEQWTSKIKLSEKGSADLHDAFKGVFDVVSLLADGFIGLLNAILPVEKPIGSLGDGLLGMAGNIGRVLSQLTDWVRESPIISKAYEMFSGGIKLASGELSILIDRVFGFVSAIKNFPFVQKVIDSVRNALDNFGGAGEKFRIRIDPVSNILEVLSNVVKKTGPVLTNIFNKIGDGISFLLSSISKALGEGGFNGIIDLLNTGLFVGILTGISKFIENITVTISKAGGMFSGVNRILFQVKNTLLTFQAQLKANILKNIAIAIAILAGSLLVLSMIDSDKLTTSLGAVTVLMGELFATMTGFNKMMAGSKTSVIKISTGLIGLSIAVSVLAGAMKKISDIDPNKIIGSLGAISALLVEMTGVAIILSKYGGKVQTGVVGIVAFSASIYILASAVKKLGDLDVEVLKKGIVSVGALLAELSAFMIAAKFGSFKTTQAVGIVVLAASLLILQKAVEGFGSMNSDKLMTGLIAVGGVLTEIAAFTFAAGESKHVMSTSISVMIMAKALEMLEKPLSLFGNMNANQIGKSLLVMGGSLAEITLAMRLMPKNILSISVGLIAVSSALTTISSVVLNMSGMTWEEIGKGMAALGGSMGILALSMNAMKGTLGASAAMLVMATSLAIFAPVLKSLSSMSWGDIAKGLITLASGFVVIGASAGLLSPLIPSMLGLASVMALLGVAVVGVGVGVLALSAGLTALAGSGIAGAAALVEVVKILTAGVLNTIKESAISLGEAVKTIILIICDVIVECIPQIVKTLLIVTKEVLTALTDNAPEIVSQLLKFAIGVIDTFASELPTLIQSVVSLFMQFFSGVIQALKGFNTDVLIDGLMGIGLMSGIMVALAALAQLSTSAMAGVLAMGVVIAELAVVLAAIGALSKIPGLNWLIGAGGEMLKGIGIAIGEFVGGIIGGVINGISSQLPKMGSDLSAFMNNLKPFIVGSKNIDAKALLGVGLLSGIVISLTAAEIINGLSRLIGLSLVDMAIELSNFMMKLQPFIINSKQISPDSMKACEYLASMIIALTAANLLSGIGRFFGLGGSISDFGKELSEFGPYIKKFADDVKDVKPEAVQGAASAAEIMANLAEKLPAQGGLVQKIFGEKSLSEFGEELVSFGPKIARFANQVKDVDPAAITGCSLVTTIMTNLANNLPTSETLWDKIFGGGQVTLSEFGEELVKFGYSMSSFSASVSGVNAEQVSGAVTSFKELVDLTTYMQGVSATDLVNFSIQLGQIGVDSVDRFVEAFENSDAKAAKAVSSLCKAITSTLKSESKNVNATAKTLANDLCDNLRMGITQKQLIVISTSTSLANAIVNTLKVNLPSNTFNIIGQNSIQALINGISSRRPSAQSTVKNMCTTIINQFKSSLPQATFKTIGENLVTWIIKGIDNKKPTLLKNIKSICSEIIKKFKTELPQSTFKGIGQNIIQGLIDGMNDKKSDAVSTAKSTGDVIKDALSSALSRDAFKEIGANAALGLKDGIESKISEIKDAAVKAAKAAIEAAKKELKVKSPSRVFFEIGNFASIGLANGIVDQIKSISKAGTKAADGVIKPVKKAMDGVSSLVEGDAFAISDPVIKPVVDLSDIERSATDIASLMSRTYDLSFAVDKAFDAADSFSIGKKSVIKNSDNMVNGGSNIKYEFNQYNTSPKALSRTEIYRQTSNQFTSFRKAVNPS